MLAILACSVPVDGCASLQNLAMDLGDQARGNFRLPVVRQVAVDLALDIIAGISIIDLGPDRYSTSDHLSLATIPSDCEINDMKARMRSRCAITLLPCSTFSG